jgi:short-subunit dehydrogenase
MPSVIVITGASSGLGRALALEYAERGAVLGLLGRSSARLEETAAAVRAKGAEAHIAALDVTDETAMTVWLREFDVKNPIDLIIANAGISAGPGFGQGESLDQVKRIFDTNLYGVLNTLHPALERMAARKKGQAAIISSVAGFRALPNAPAYAASKAAVRFYGQGLRGLYAPQGVKINVVCPGFIETRMTEVNEFPMPFLMSPEKAAGIIRTGLKRNKPVIAFPWIMALAVKALNFIPDFIVDAVAAKLPAKPSK